VSKSKTLNRLLVALHLGLASSVALAAEPMGPKDEVARQAQAQEAKVIGWRRDIHAHPELGNQEQRTSALVADHLRNLGLEVRTGVARTGVVGILRGSRPGPVVALRADMDALPVKEPQGLSFASTARSTYLGREVDVMHACGHDGHVAILMGVAQVLATLKDKLPGTVVFYFQPAEEGPSDFTPDGQNSWGAKLMVQDGVMREPKPDAVFGLHLWAGVPAGQIAYRPGPTLASSDDLRIRILGRQTHAGRPWDGVDPIVTSAQVLLGLQTVISRQTDISRTPSVVSIGTISGGTRYNIIPDAVEMTGTIRSYEDQIRKGVHEKVRRTVEGIADSAGAKADVTIIEKYDPTINDEPLTERMLPTLRWAANGDVVRSPLVGAAEDFSFFAKQAPGLFVFLGITPRDQDMAKAAPNHSPAFFVDESALIVGVRALAGLAVDYLATGPKAALR
jgi:amidohydrolase